MGFGIKAEVAGFIEIEESKSQIVSMLPDS